MGFQEQLHPRGTGAQGGQFVAKGASGANSTVGYDAKKGTGAGYGAKGGDKRVKQLQEYLNSLGIKDGNGQPLKVDGKLGPKTTMAIKRLQTKLGMKPDGLVSPALLGRLRRASARVKAGTYGPAGNSGARKAPAKRAAPSKKAPAKKTAAPAKKAAAKKAAPVQSKTTQPQRARVSRSVPCYSNPMDDLIRHAQHNQKSHGNRVGRPNNVAGKTGLSAKAGQSAHRARIGTHNAYPGDEVKIVMGDRNRMGTHNPTFGKIGRHEGWVGDSQEAITRFPDGKTVNVHKSNLEVTRTREDLDDEDRKANDARVAELRKKTAELRKRKAAEDKNRPTPVPIKSRYQ